MRGARGLERNADNAGAQKRPEDRGCRAGAPTAKASRGGPRGLAGVAAVRGPLGRPLGGVGPAGVFVLPGGEAGVVGFLRPPLDFGAKEGPWLVVGAVAEIGVGLDVVDEPSPVRKCGPFRSWWWFLSVRGRAELALLRPYGEECQESCVRGRG
jgi:hypothetical protein